MCFNGPEFLRDRSGQTVQIQMRLVLNEQSDPSKMSSLKNEDGSDRSVSNE